MNAMVSESSYAKPNWSTEAQSIARSVVFQYIQTSEENNAQSLETLLVCSNEPLSDVPPHLLYHSPVSV